MKIKPTERSSVNAWEQAYFRQKSSQRQSGLQTWWHEVLKRWYRLAAPPEPPLNATLTQRERARRGRLASIILLAALIYCIFSVITGFLNQNFVNTGVFAFLLIADYVLITVNKHGHLLLVGIIFIALDQLATLQIFFTPGGLSMNDLPRLDTLAVQILLCITFLPPIGSIILALANCIYIWLILTYVPHQADLTATFAAHQGSAIMARPMILNILVAVVLYLWASSAENAIARADRAESIAALEHTIAEQEHEIAEEKEQLERSIQLIAETHRRIANGDESARVPLDDRNRLWPVAGMLNNLLSRLQFLRRESHELALTRQEAEHLATILRQVRMNKNPGRFANTGTALDTVAVELVNQGLLYPPSGVKRNTETNFY